MSETSRQWPSVCAEHPVVRFGTELASETEPSQDVSGYRHAADGAACPPACKFSMHVSTCQHSILKRAFHAFWLRISDHQRAPC